jgi:hypothetical protein
MSSERERAFAWEFWHGLYIWSGPAAIVALLSGFRPNFADFSLQGIFVNSVLILTIPSALAWLAFVGAVLPIALLSNFRKPPSNPEYQDDRREESSEDEWRKRNEIQPE